jgi:hypothetical protein
MATRASIAISNMMDEPVACIYHHYDGNPDCLGVIIRDFLEGGKFVTGLNSEAKMGTQFNGIEDFATQLIVHLKGDTPGMVYLETPSNFGDLGEDWLYRVCTHSEGATLECMPNHPMMNFENDWENLNEVLEREALKNK